MLDHVVRDAVIAALSRAGADMAQVGIDQIVVEAVNDIDAAAEPRRPHDWLHDGTASTIVVDGVIRSNRLCRTCRFREYALGDLPCFGSPDLFESARRVGHREGERHERDRMREVLGL